MLIGESGLRDNYLDKRRYSYDPYGQILTDTTGTSGQAYKYTGKPLSSTTGLYYYGARWYDPAVGRFTGQDPARDGGNWYQYCDGNPVIYTDPNGQYFAPFLTLLYSYLSTLMTSPDFRADIAEIQNDLNRGDIPSALVSIGATLIPALPAVQAKVIAKLVDKVASGVKGPGNFADTGYKTFNALKKVLGSPGEGRAWHHIVEQSQIKKSGFATELINNVKNVISIDSATHAKISGFYSSKLDFTGGLTVRDWLASKSFEFQYEYGLKVLRDNGVIK